MNKAQQERLIILGEEATEVAHAVSKALRFGLDDINPITEESAAEAIERELGDMHYVANWLFAKGDLLFDNVATSMGTKAMRMAPHLLYQEEEEDGKTE